MTSSQSPAQRLRGLLAGGELITAPGIFDGLSAHLVRRMGFPAGYLTGAGVAAAGFGLPDIGLVGMAEMADRVAMVAGVLGEIPLIADADTGYGPPPSVARTVRAYERAGVAAPNRSGVRGQCCEPPERRARRAPRSARRAWRESASESS